MKAWFVLEWRDAEYTFTLRVVFCYCTEIEGEGYSRLKKG